MIYYSDVRIIYLSKNVGVTEHVVMTGGLFSDWSVGWETDDKIYNFKVADGYWQISLRISTTNQHFRALVIY